MKVEINKNTFSWKSLKLFNVITSNGCREMNEIRFEQALKKYRQSIIDEIDEVQLEVPEEYKDDLDYVAGYGLGVLDTKEELKSKLEE